MMSHWLGARVRVMGQVTKLPLTFIDVKLCCQIWLKKIKQHGMKKYKTKQTKKTKHKKKGRNMGENVCRVCLEQ